MDVNVTVSIYPFLSSILWASSIQKTKKICQWLSWMFTGYFLIYWKAGVTHFLGDFSSFWVWNKNIDNNFKFSVNLILFLSLLGPFIFSQLCGQLWWASFPMLSYFLCSSSDFKHIPFTFIIDLGAGVRFAQLVSTFSHMGLLICAQVIRLDVRQMFQNGLDRPFLRLFFYHLYQNNGLSISSYFRSHNLELRLSLLS